jgi:peptidoglycan/LPS O-acetylase OafA/YrhL
MLGLALWFRNDATDYLFPVALAAFSFALLRRGSAIFINRFTCMVGKISFSAYITHFAAIKVVEKALAGRHLASPQLAFCAIYAGALFVTLAAASVTYFAVERPGMELGRRLIKFFNKPGDGLHLPANTLKT